MGIDFQCGCGKQIGVANTMAGRFVRCPQCDGDVLVPKTSARAGGKSAASPARKKPAAAPSVVISPTLVTAGIIGGVLAIIVLALYLGPWRVGNQWAAMNSRANDEVTDVIDYALQAYDSQHPDFNSKIIHAPPQLQGPASFIPPMMAFTMPANIIFLGKTSRGNYTGTWDTTTGEVVANIETNGWTIGGLADARKASNTIRITGREKDGKVSAEMDGQPLVKNW
jgi:DNA-directed RNA polymerase subunit RPC12/RpoP